MQTRDGGTPFRTLARRPLPYLLLGALVCLYLRSFILPRTPIFYSSSDALLFLFEAARMFQGQMIYRDFFEFALPGTQYVYLALFKLLGMRAWIPNAMLVLLGVSLAWTGAAISKRLMSGRFVFLPSLLFLGFAFVTDPDATHHWYSTLAVMVALVILIEGRSWGRVATAGFLCGLATLFTQNRGVPAVVGIAVFLWWEWRAKKQSWRGLLQAEISLCIPFLATILGAVAYLTSGVGFQRFAYCTVVFPLKYYSLNFWNSPAVYLTDFPLYPLVIKLPAMSVWLFIHFLLPLVYLLFLVRWWQVAKARPEEPWDRLMLLSIVGFFMFLGVAFSPSWLRLCSVSLPALILFVWFVKSSGKYSLTLSKYLWIIGAALLVGQCAIAQAGWRAYLDAPTGRVAFLEPEVYEKFRWVRERTRPGDYLFQAAHWNLYYLLSLRNPAQVSFLTSSGYSRPEQVQDVIEALERSRARFVLWGIWLDTPFDNHDRQFDPRHLAPIRDYLRTHYHLVRNFGEPEYEQVWERNP